MNTDFEKDHAAAEQRRQYLHMQAVSNSTNDSANYDVFFAWAFFILFIGSVYVGIIQPANDRLTREETACKQAGGDFVQSRNGYVCVGEQPK